MWLLIFWGGFFVIAPRRFNAIKKRAAKSYTAQTELFTAYVVEIYFKESSCVFVLQIFLWPIFDT